MDGTFPRFGAAHLTALAIIPMAGYLLARTARQNPRLERPIQFTLAAMLTIATVSWVLALVWHYNVGWKWILPLQLSDASIVLTVLVTLTLNQWLFDVVFYWGLTAVPLAMLMPDILEPFPDPFTISFFVLHGLVVVILLYLVWSGQMRPRPSAAMRSFLALNAFMLLVLAVNLLLGTNYMYLMEKASQPSPLDYFGPWPWYIVTSEFVAMALFGLLGLPFRRARAIAAG
ncbi:MAG: TIGR02206 family membrane protein [Bryobacterales bacterium]|nr:TIGR02206 family membrane protein [Bryobacterales bacterium]